VGPTRERAFAALPHPNPASGRSCPRHDLNRAGHGLPDAPEGEGLKKSHAVQDLVLDSLKADGVGICQTLSPLSRDRSPAIGERGRHCHHAGKDAVGMADAEQVGEQQTGAVGRGFGAGEDGEHGMFGVRRAQAAIEIGTTALVARSAIIARIRISGRLNPAPKLASIACAAAASSRPCAPRRRKANSASRAPGVAGIACGVAERAIGASVMLGSSVCRHAATICYCKSIAINPPGSICVNDAANAGSAGFLPRDAPYEPQHIPATAPTDDGRARSIFSKTGFK
jgi:hypothetical protein